MCVCVCVFVCVCVHVRVCVCMCVCAFGLDYNSMESQLGNFSFQFVLCNWYNTSYM